MNPMDISQNLRNLSPGTLLSGLLICWIVYIISLAFYRLSLSPISKFPGPKLAALSSWYEFYYEIVKKGQFSFHIQKLHQKYGPIVRITPEELHVQDSSFWDTLYARNPKAEKYKRMNGRFGNAASVFTTCDPTHHRLRRSALNPMFSKRAIGQFEPFIRQKTSYLCKRFAQYKDSGQVLPINKAWDALTGDVVMEYAFGFNYNHLRSNDFGEAFHDSFMTVSDMTHVSLQFPWLIPLMNALPDSVVQIMNPKLEKIIQLQRDLRKNVFRIIQEQGEAEKQPQQTTVFHEILQSNLPPGEKSLRRLGDEAQTVIGAGTSTTAWALCNAFYYIVADQRVHDTLHDELRAAVPDPSSPDALNFQRLESLPYLRACIREGIRLSHGVSARNPRVLNTPLSYDNWVIPPRTPVSMTIMDVHFDERIYPKPKEFVPERWLDDPQAPDGNSLDRYFVAFGKGSRACLGINLAYMVLFITLGTVFRCFRFELYKTDVSDVELAHDMFIPRPKLDSKGIRVKVKEVYN